VTELSNPSRSRRGGARLAPWLIALLFVLAVGVGRIAEMRSERIAFTPDPGHAVVLLSTRWCGYCARMRTFLERNGVSFDEWDVESSEPGRRAWARFGRPGVPVVLVDGEPIFGFDLDGVARALTSAK
jgi:glutaredoxin